MTDSKLSPAGKRMTKGLREVLADIRGEKPLAARDVSVPDEVDVAQIRGRFKMSQSEFATAFGISLASLQNWEQGHRKPDSMARAFLSVIDKEPDAVRRALGD